MPKRRSNGEGCITKERSGRYRIIVSVVVGGKRIRKTRTAWKMADATAILNQMRSETNLYEHPHRLTVAKYLEMWIRDTIAGERRDNTDSSYRFAIEKHINPRIGSILLREFGPIHVQTWLAEMSRDEVGSRTRENAFVVLRAAMNHATVLKLITESPCASIAKPKHVTEKMNPFTLEEAKLILSETTGTRFHALLQLAMTAGLRQGELLGLPWNAIDWRNGTVRVEQQAVSSNGKVSLAAPKTESSVRTVEMTAACIDSLQAHKAIMLAEGNAGNELVFPAPEGGIECRGNFRTRFWNSLLVHLELAHRGFHNTRHTYATLALGAGVPITVVSANLGHSKVSTTLDIYAHVLESHNSAATETVARLFG